MLWIIQTKSENKHLFYLIAFASVYFLLMSTFALWKYWGHMHSMYDIGNMVQPLWYLFETGKPLSTMAPPFEVHNRFGFHFTPILLLLSPVYLLFGAEGLVVSHCFFITATAFIIYQIAQEFTFSRKNSFLIGIIFLLNPFILNAHFWDFRPLSIGCFLVALGYLFMLRKNLLAFALTCGLMLMVKENMGIYVAGLGLVWAYQNREYKKGFIIFTLGLAAAYLIVMHIMPALLGTEQHAMLARGETSINRYFWIFEPYDEMKKHFDLLFIESSAPYLYIFFLFGSLLFLPIAEFIFLLPAGGDLLLNILSRVGLPKAYFSYHSLATIPCFVVAAIAYIQNSNYQEKLVKYVLVCTVTVSFILSPFPLLINANVWQHQSFMNFKDDNIETIKKLVGDRAVSAQINIGGDFAERKFAYPFPDGVEKSDFVILHNYIPTKNASFMSLHPEKEIEKLLQDKRFELVYQAENWHVFERK